MGRFEVGDKIVLEISGIDGKYIVVDKCVKPLSEYTESIEKKNHRKQHQIERLVMKLHRQADEITRLLKENEELKKSMEIIRDKAFEAGQVKGQNDAWELALKLRYMDYEDKVECFDLEYDGKEKWIEIMEKYTYTEAAAKIAEWERKKEEICVGDVVTDGNGESAVVTFINDIGTVFYIWNRGVTRQLEMEKFKKLFTKTGRHIDVASMLAQIGGDCNE